jgi:hypothetical protein
MTVESIFVEEQNIQGQKVVENFAWFLMSLLPCPLFHAAIKHNAIIYISFSFSRNLTRNISEHTFTFLGSQNNTQSTCRRIWSNRKGSLSRQIHYTGVSKSALANLYFVRQGNTGLAANVTSDLSRRRLGIVWDTHRHLSSEFTPTWRLNHQQNDEICFPAPASKFIASFAK